MLKRFCIKTWHKVGDGKQFMSLIHCTLLLNPNVKSECNIYAHISEWKKEKHRQFRGNQSVNSTFCYRALTNFLKMWSFACNSEETRNPHIWKNNEMSSWYVFPKTACTRNSGYKNLECERE